MTRDLYHSAVYDTASCAPSYWEDTAGERPACQPLTGSETTDVAIIGGGFTGLSAALHLARDHGIQAHLLEAGPIAWGASGRNGGFCVAGASKLSIEQMVARYGVDETRGFYRSQVEAIELVRSLCEEESIACDRVGEGLHIVAHKRSAFRALQSEAAWLRDQFAIPAVLYDADAFPDVGHDSREQYGALHVGVGFGIHPLRFATGLARAAQRHGARLHEHSAVLDWSRDQGQHVLHTPGGTLRAKRVIVATNGYYREGLHPALDDRMLPVISNIITTRPLTHDEQAAHQFTSQVPAVNTRRLLFYYRLLPDGRLLFGARGDSTGRPADGARMKAWMTRRLGEVFPAWREVEISHYWRGLICVNRRLTPALGHLDEDASVWYGLSYHGNGVNTAPWAGRQLARAVAGEPTAIESLPVMFRGLPGRFPVPRMRIPMLRAASLWYRLRDAT